MNKVTKLAAGSEYGMGGYTLLAVVMSDIIKHNFLFKGRIKCVMEIVTIQGVGWE